MNETRIEDFFLCDPISKRGREALSRIQENFPEVKMTFNDFYSKKVYVQPFFLLNNNTQPNHCSEINRESSQNIDPEFTISGTQRRKMINKKKDFEKLFFSNSTCPLLTIRAASGSGKSIYLNYLKYKRRRKNKINLNETNSYINGKLNNAYELNFDLEYSKASLEKGRIKFPSEEYVTTVLDNSGSATLQFFIMILESTYENIISVIKENDSKRFNNIKKNFEFLYKENYIDEIENIYNQIELNSNLSSRERATKLLDSLILYGLKNCKNIRDCIKNMLKLLTRFLTCNSDLQNPKQILISFDNIEHYIDRKNRVFDNDIGVISDAVFKFIEDEENYYSEIGLKFSSFFKIIMVIRDTTNKMLSQNASMQHYFTLYVENSIDVTNWYLPAEIYSNKLEFFEKYIDNNTSMKFFNLIVKDQGVTTGSSFMQLLSSMYNHNKRRTTRILANISELFENLSTNNTPSGSCLNYEQFEILFSKAIKRANRDSLDYRNIRYLCRQSLLRLVYNEIHSTGYFNRIYGRESFPSSKKTYARRILTYLVNNKNYDTEDYISFYEILKALLCCPGSNDTQFDKDEFNKIAEILIALNEYEFSSADDGASSHESYGPNKWCQLIIIKFNNPDFDGSLDSEKLSQKLIEEYSSQNRSTDNFGIRITEAGCFFARILCNYEYFLCRCSDNYTPLFFMLNKDVITNSIKNVFTKAKECIDSTFIQEKALYNGDFKAGYDNNYNLHIKKANGQSLDFPLPIRIIIRHTDYLQKYKSFLTNEKLQKDIKLFDDESREDIINQVETYIQQYKGIEKQIINSEYTIKYNGEEFTIKDYLPEQTKNSLIYFT